MPKQQDGKTSKAGSTASVPGAAAAYNPTSSSTANPGVLDQAKETVSNVASQAGDKVTSRLDAQKDRAAEGLSSIVQALRQTGEKLREENKSGPAHEYLNSATDRVERVADYIRSNDVRQMVEQVEQFARRQPALFISTAFVLGLVGARFFKSSGQTNAGYAGPTPRDESLVPASKYAGMATASTGSASYRASTGSAQAVAPPTTSPGDYKGGV